MPRRGQGGSEMSTTAPKSGAALSTQTVGPASVGSRSDVSSLMAVEVVVVQPLRKRSEDGVNRH